MTRLPDHTALGERLPRAASGEVRYSGESPVGAALQRAGSTLAGIGNQILQEQAQKAEQTLRFDTAARFTQFSTNLDQKYEEAARAAPSGAAGFRDKFVEALENEQRGFFGTVPENLKPEYYARLSQQRERYAGVAGQYQEREHDRHFTARVGDVTNELLRKVQDDPDSFEAWQSDGLRLIGEAPLPGPVKEELARRWRRQAQSEAWRSLAKRNPQAALRMLDPSGAQSRSGPAAGGNASLAFSYLTRKLGYSPTIAAGIVGNLMQESGEGIDTGAVGDGGNSFGAVQWNGPRKQAFLEWAEASGRDANDLTAQLDYLDVELKGSERSALEAVRNATSPAEAAVILSRAFWRPGDPREENRARYAESVLGGAPVDRAAIAGPRRMVGRNEWSSRHYSWEELRNHRFGDAAKMDARVGEALDSVTDAFGQKLRITSGFRSSEHNEKVSFSKDSRHTHGDAIDIDVSGYTDEQKRQLVELFVAAGATGLGHYDNGSIHVDFRDGGGKGPGGLALWYNQNENYTRGEKWFGEGVDAGLAQRGREPDPRFADIPADERRQLIEDGWREVDAQYRARREQNTAETFEVTRLIRSDVASREATGVGVEGLTPERVAKALGEREAARYAEDRAVADATYAAVSGIGEMTEAEMAQRVAETQPDPGSPVYEAQARVAAKTRAAVDAQLRLRRSDPALAVAEHRAVKAAVEEAGDGAQEAVVAARLAAQEAIRIAADSRAPVPRDEAREVLAMMRAVAGMENDDRPAATAAMLKQAREKYGQYADEVIDYAIRTEAPDRDSGRQYADLLRRTLRGEQVTTDRLREAEQKRADANRSTGIAPVTSDPMDPANPTLVVPPPGIGLERGLGLRVVRGGVPPAESAPQARQGAVPDDPAGPPIEIRRRMVNSPNFHITFRRHADALLKHGAQRPEMQVSYARAYGADTLTVLRETSDVEQAYDHFRGVALGKSMEPEE